MSEVWSLESLKGRISSFYNEKQAAEKAAQGNMPSETDPQEKSAPAAEKHDGDSAEKTVLPAAGLAAENRDGNAENNIPSGGEASGKAPNEPEKEDTVLLMETLKTKLLAVLQILTLQRLLLKQSLLPTLFVKNF